MASHSAHFVLQDETSGPLDIHSFLGFIRLQNDTSIITSYSHNANNSTTTGIILQADESEMRSIKEHVLYFKAFAGHELLLRAVLTEMSLHICIEHLTEIKQDVMDIEHSTGQHTWDNYSPRDEKPKPDVELSRVAHGLRIQVAVVCRRIEVVLLWLELQLDNLTQNDEACAKRSAMLQWARNMQTHAKMAKLDVELIAKRTDNQVGAIYNRFAQRDNITTQKISEATNRDSSAMKSLAVLGALFFPGTFIATLFCLPALQAQPFWMYWIITGPVTFIVLGAWMYWTYWRIESVKARELSLDSKAMP